MAPAKDDSVPLLIKALADPEMPNRLRAIKILASLGNKALAAVPALEGLRANPKNAVRLTAKDTLQAIRGEKR
jgi:HEAT repeat protein